MLSAKLRMTNERSRAAVTPIFTSGFGRELLYTISRRCKWFASGVERQWVQCGRGRVRQPGLTQGAVPVAQPPIGRAAQRRLVAERARAPTPRACARPRGCALQAHGPGEFVLVRHLALIDISLSSVHSVL